VRERTSTAQLPAEEWCAPEAGRGESPAEPLVLGRYRLQRRLGSGGFGVVWLAYDERLQRQVAIKEIPRAGDDGDRAQAARAEREARVAARLNHPGIVALYELGADEEAVYLVSELVHGRTLAQLVAAGALSDRDVARIGAALCDALAHAHERGVVHRDVKPQNVIVVAEPAAGAGFAKLADFGVAEMAGSDPLTRTGDVVGTLAYMAPEQAEGRRATPAADVYALALTLYEGWTGSNPVRARGPAATARRLGRPVPPLARRRRDLPAGLCGAIDAALDTRPERRTPLSELRTALVEATELLADEGGLDDGALEPERPLTVRLAGRAGAGLAAGGLALAALESLGPAPPASPSAVAGCVAALVALLPRAGWGAAALCLCGWLASADAGREGTALVVAAALAPVPLLLPRAGLLWCVPALAPLAGAAGVAPAYLALAGLASTAWRRAALGALGALWVVVAEIVTGSVLLFGRADGTLDRGLWDSSLGVAASDAIYPTLSSPALAPMAVWALLAALLPLAVRGRSLLRDLVGAGVWAAALVTAHSGLGDLLAASARLGDARGAVAGAVLGGAAVLAWAEIDHRRSVAGTPLP
jgi:eukaryotic-like serine/threonine-protein kinase